MQVGQQTLGAPGEDPQLSFQGFDGQGIGDMTFSDAGRAGQQQIFVAVDKGTTGQVLDEGPVNAGRGGEVKAGQGFAAEEYKATDAARIYPEIEEESSSLGGMLRR